VNRSNSFLLSLEIVRSTRGLNLSQLDLDPSVKGHFLAERFGSGDGERKTWLTRQIAFEPLPASVLPLG
jgi:hypothetical protein